MINPSASGWIDKFFYRYTKKLSFSTNPYDFYRNVRDSGFIYGYTNTLQQLDAKDCKGWTNSETTKVGLLLALYELYRNYTGNEGKNDFVEKVILFYKEMTPEGYRLLKKVLPSSKKIIELESILEQRIRTNDNIISRNFSHILTNALLFIDITAFRHFLEKNYIPKEYLKKLETTVVDITSLTLQVKNEKTPYDDLLLRMLEASIRYTKLNKRSIEELGTLDLSYFTLDLERFYLLDIATMAMWNEMPVQEIEISYLHQLADELTIDEACVVESIADYDVFLKKHKKNIPFFKYSNPVKHFYDHATQNVVNLIKRNKRRLVKELSNNRELVVLLTHSTHRSLNGGEKKKVKKQLLEICKTVPSLTIFLLPGGSLLLPLLIKFIPQLLPSVFNENLDNE